MIKIIKFLKYSLGFPYYIRILMREYKNSKEYNGIIHHYHKTACAIRTETGLNLNERKEKIIVSLTSIPERINSLYLVISSILEQTIKADVIILWLDEDNFSIDNIPKELKKLTSRGLSIKFCRNIRSYKKLIYTLKEYPNDIIITCDDDVIMPLNWLESLYHSYLSDPECVHCIWGTEITCTGNKINDWENFNTIDSSSPVMKNPSINLIGVGVGGIVYRKSFFSEEVFNESVWEEYVQMVMISGSRL